MLYLAKIVQAIGLSFLAIRFALSFPDPLHGRDVAMAAGVFGAGWLMTRIKR